jgi:diacylglycerol kinase (ATP)
MLIAVVHNPGAGDSSIGLDDVVSAVRRGGHRVESWSTDEADWAGAIGGDHALVIAAGGDGTVGKVFKALAGTSQAATIIPLGTSNNIARTLGLPLEHPLASVRYLETGSLVDFDVPLVTADGWGQLVVEGLAAGLMPRLIAASQQRFADRPTEEERWSLFRQVLSSTRPDRWDIGVDGHRAADDVIGVHVMNVQYTGPTVRLSGSPWNLMAVVLRLGLPRGAGSRC